MSIRDKLLVIALVLLLVAASAGAIIAEQGLSATVPTYGGSYVEGVVGGSQHLEPLTAATPLDRDVSRLLFTGLTRVDRSGEIVPDLAASVHVDEDGKSWTFEIREDARWHDGRPVVADDVIYTVGLFQDPAYGGPYAEAFRGVALQRLGPRAVRFVLPGPYGPFAASTTFPLLPAHRLGGVPFSRLADDPFDRSPVGTGPFKLGDIGAREIVLVANEDFYRTAPGRTRPFLDRLVLRSFADASQALTALAAGELDAVSTVSSQDAERLRSLRSVSVYSYPTNDFVALFLNVRPDRPTFRDRAVRQAIALAIDRGRVLDVAVDGRGQVADTFVPPSSWAYPKDLPKYQHSLDDAKTLLDGAGWLDSDADGTRDKDGISLRFEIVTSDATPRLEAAAQIVSDLALVGIAARVRSLPFDEMIASVAKPRRFDALLVGITSPTDPDPYTFFHSSQAEDPGLNFSGYATLPMDRALESARALSDREARRAIYAPLLQGVATESPVVFLYFADHLYAQHVSVKGLKIKQIVEPSERFWDVEDWYLKTLPRR